MARSVVDFPAPFAPRMLTISPCRTAMSMPCRASTLPYFTRRPSVSRSGAVTLDLLRAQVRLDHSRIRLDGGRRPLGDLLPVLQHHDVLAGPHHEAHVVLDEQDGDAARPDPADEPDELLGLLLVHPTGRLVQDEEL